MFTFPIIWCSGIAIFSLAYIFEIDKKVKKFWNKYKMGRYSNRHTPRMGRTVHSCSLHVGHATVYAHYVEMGRHVVGFRSPDLACQLALPSKKRSEKV